MCLILFAWKTNPRYHLILAANRDEFFVRPSSPASFWPDHPGLLAGRDLKAGGTWLGVTTSGRFAAITNYRDLSNIKEDAPSRGNLTLDYLISATPPRDYLDSIAAVGGQYNGFNLLIGDLNEIFYYSNIENRIQQLEPGLYGLSNHLLDTGWPKVERGKEMLSKAIDDKAGASDILDLLANREKSPDRDLPDTGIPLEWERALSAMHIDMEEYGTVSSTVLLASPASFYFKERSYNKPQGTANDNEFQSQWSAIIQV